MFFHKKIGTNSHFISNSLVHGDKRKYLSAILTLNIESIIQYANRHNIAFQSEGELLKNSRIYELIEKEVNSVNKHLASFETIKKFTILNRDFTIEEGELTPSLKVKRNFCEKRYSDILNNMYVEQVYS